MADPITGALVGGAAGEILGGIAGEIFGRKDRKRARKLAEQSVRDVEGVNAEAGDSAMGGVNADPRMVAAQRSVLSRLMQEGNASGLGLQDRVALSEAQGQVGRQERGSREAILQSMSQRGMGGSGAELAAALTNQQGSADRSASVGARAAADARGRQLAALSQSGEMAGTVRGQDFGEQSEKAQAADAIAKFNAAQRLSKGGMLSGARGGQAGVYGNQADRFAQMGAGIGSAAGQGIGFAAAGGYAKKKPGAQQ